MSAIEPAALAGLRRRIETPEGRDRLIIAPTHRVGDFTSHGVDCPFVFTVDGRTGMTVVGWDGTGYQTGLSWLGEDGEWSTPELVFARDEHSVHRRYNAALTSILRDDRLDGSGELISVDGWYYGAWHAYPAPGYEEGSAVIGIARSRDLIVWEEFGEPLRPEDGGAWERGGLYKAWLARIDDRYWLFYNAKDLATGSWVEQTGAATSADLHTWVRVSDEPLLGNGPAGSGDERFASDPCVLRDSGTSFMFYFGLAADGHAREFFAVSTDLREWTKDPVPLLDHGPAGSIDATHAHKPAVITRDGRLEHYYCAVSPLDEPVDLGGYRQSELRGIAVARSAPRDTTAARDAPHEGNHHGR